MADIRAGEGTGFKFFKLIYMKKLLSCFSLLLLNMPHANLIFILDEIMIAAWKNGEAISVQ